MPDDTLSRIEEALRRPPDVRIPPHFRERLLARVSEPAPAEVPETSWALLAAATLFAALGAALLWSGAGVIEALSHLAVLAAAAGVEAALSLFWLWRTLEA